MFDNHDKHNPETASRRQILTRATMTLGAMAVGLDAVAAPRSPRQEADAKHITHLHQEVTVAASPHRIFEALLDDKQFAALTGASAKIDRREGGAFATFGGIIIGRTIELTPDKLIVQAWKPKYWEPGVYSLVRFGLVPDGLATKIVLDHSGFPEGAYAGLNSGWPERYWEPLKKYLA